MSPIPLLFAVALFLSATLLFAAQPMTARMLLPSLGGTPAVWVTASVFFQAVLLAGYGYAHVVGTRLSLKAQVAVHVLVVAVAAVSLPPGLPEAWTADVDQPIRSMLGALGIMVGAPFFVLSTTGSLLQRWFSLSGHPRASDPYFLYATSNAGSLLGLLSYPLLVEPLFGLSRQAQLWSGGYGLLAVVILACGLVALRNGRAALPDTVESAGTPPRARDQLQWLLLALVPASLSLGFTSHLSADLASIPLLWVLPLAVYLLTWIAAFGRHGPTLARLGARLAPFAAVLAAALFQVSSGRYFLLTLVAELSILFVMGLACHGRLATLRPAPRWLTAFYLQLALGGALGSAFNALVAPSLFHNLTELPIMLAAGAALVAFPGPREGRGPLTRQLGGGLLLGLAFWGVLTIAETQLAQESARTGLFPLFWPALLLGVGLLFPWLQRRPALQLPALSVLLLLSFGSAHVGEAEVLARGRSFFGRYQVLSYTNNTWHGLRHGQIFHGWEGVGPLSGKPTSYYHPSGPIGGLFMALQEDPRLETVGVVGMGAGSLAAYARPGQQWVFFEIDPDILQIAVNPEYFTFLARARERRDGDEKVDIRFFLGDGRQGLEQSEEGRFGVLVLDAFSGDSIPVHLLTLEAIQADVSRLRPGGLLAFHVSNRHVDLEPVLSAAAAAIGWHAWLREDDGTAHPEEGQRPSIWMVLAREESDVAPVLAQGGWRPAREAEPERLWTDDHVKLLGSLRW